MHSGVMSSPVLNSNTCTAADIDKGRQKDDSERQLMLSKQNLVGPNELLQDQVAAMYGYNA